MIYRNSLFVGRLLIEKKTRHIYRIYEKNFIDGGYSIECLSHKEEGGGDTCEEDIRRYFNILREVEAD